MLKSTTELTPGVLVGILDAVGGITMSIANYFPVFSKLTPQQQQMVLDYTAVKTVPAGTVVHNGAVE